MVIHLESGTCESGVNLPFLNRLAAQCFQWKKYLSKEYRNELLAGDTGYREVSAQPFKCPRCEEAFPLLSTYLEPGLWAGAERRCDWEVEEVDREADVQDALALIVRRGKSASMAAAVCLACPTVQKISPEFLDDAEDRCVAGGGEGSELAEFERNAVY
ncbi:uncharacterized protein RHO25_012883 [Cercospora beticola]|uniref:Uncharacterized protein n=1 Tax=Cercospora beticola TaxID=122368 RepID=A0ABZ0P8M5_CERBT|nr:hypothetical protein RHO25_012883 [Cercospora beticola]